MPDPHQYHNSYQVTTMTPSWILESHAQKISQNYVIVLTKFRCESTVPPDMIFLSQFGILTGNQTGVKGKYLNIESSIQPGTGGQYP